MRRAGAFSVAGALFALLLCAFFVSLLPGSAGAQPAPDLTISKDGPARVEPGQRFTYTIVVRNTGNDPATVVEVTDRLPRGVDFVASNTAACTAGPPDEGRVTVTCAFANLAPEARRRIELTVRAPNRVGTIENRATVDSDETERQRSNTVTTRVAPNLVIDKLDDPDPAGTEDLLLYTLRVQNEGNRVATNVGVTDDLPLDVVDFVAVDSADFDCEFKAGVVQCEGGELDPGEIAKVEVVVEPERAGTISNTAAVFSGRNRIDTDTETTRVQSGTVGNDGNGGNNGDGDDGDGSPTEGQYDNEDGKELDCASFDSQAEAQANLDANPSDPNNLDADDDGEACEVFDYGDDGTDGPENVVPGTVINGSLPNTGGFPFLIGTAALLAAATLLCVRVMRP